uniref:Uncharacterized protein n=1 Tax=Anguilla anguilla TaxID=7936 RepID=A0A0E9RZS9_ANGAN
MRALICALLTFLLLISKKKNFLAPI